MEASKDQNEANSLENTPAEGAATPVLGGANASSVSGAPEPTKHKSSIGEKVRGLIGRINIYLLMFILVLVMAGGIVLISLVRDRKAAEITIGNTPLTAEELQQISESDAKVGDPKQTLTIESNSVFSGRVLVRDDLDVAGTIRVGGALNLPGITVSGRSAFDELTVNNLAIAGNATVQGTLSVQQNLEVTGSATFGGAISAPQLTIERLSLSNDLQLNRHIDAGGGTPGKTNGSALGNGGTSSVSGSDTAGTVTINTGGSPPAGCFITVNFATSFGGTPHVVITPVGSAAASLNYYITRDSGSFRICSANPAPAGATFSFDYVAID